MSLKADIIVTAEQQGLVLKALLGLHTISALLKMAK